MKITRAMELIAASRIARAQQRVSAAQPYTRKMNEVIRNVAAASGGVSHPLLENRPVQTAGVLVVTSDRGLAGAYNVNVIRLAELRAIELIRAGIDVRVYVIGKKAQSLLPLSRVPDSSRRSSVSPTPRGTEMPGRWPTWS